MVEARASEAPRVLVAGAFAWSFYEPSFCAALERAGAEVVTLPDQHYFGPGALLTRVQTRFVRGPGVQLARAALLTRAVRTKPDVVLGWRTPWLDGRTMRLLRALTGARVVTYNNDDPFGPDRGLPIWRAYRRSLPAVDVAYVYREVNVGEALAAGAPSARVLRSAFDPAVHRPLPADDPRVHRLATDVVFVGHHEDDARDLALLALAEAGLSVRVAGPGWEEHARPLRARGIDVVGPALGDDYVAAIQAAKVTLVFLSRRNRDTYTRRCFEIPAIGTCMLAPRTADLASMFEDGRDAVLYDDHASLARAAVDLVRDDARRARIAQAGRDRVHHDGHDLDARAAAWLKDALSVHAR